MNMPTPAPGTVTASRIAVMADGSIAEVIITERSLPYGDKRADAFARWHSGGEWSGWWPVAESAEDASVSPDTSQQEPAALISVVIWVPAPGGGIAVGHVAHRSAYFRLTASGVAPADL
jgi:hypothetical protein